jgi:hypothetical protein
LKVSEDSIFIDVGDLTDGGDVVDPLDYDDDAEGAVGFWEREGTEEGEREREEDQRVEEEAETCKCLLPFCFRPCLNQAPNLASSSSSRSLGAGIPS